MFKPPIQIYQEAIYKAAHDYFASSDKEDCSKEVDALLSCLLSYTHKVISTTYAEDKNFYLAMGVYIDMLTRIGENRMGLAVLTQEMIDKFRQNREAGES